jgi:hypothetical protein
LPTTFAEIDEVFVMRAIVDPTLWKKCFRTWKYAGVREDEILDLTHRCQIFVIKSVINSCKTLLTLSDPIFPFDLEIIPQ